MKFRQTQYDFKLQVLPISGGTFSSLVRPEFQSLDVSGIFEEFIAPALYNTPKVLSSREPFTLVNVTCLHSGFSFGTMGVPPKSALPLACPWVFTFAISDETYSEDAQINYTSLRWINTRVWGLSNSRFITIGVPHTQSQYMGLKYDMLTPRIAYFLLGALSKSFVRMHKYWGNPDPKDYSRNYSQLLPSILRSSLYMVPMYNLIGRTPYHLWVFNRHVWLSAPNLLSDKHITPESLLYVLLYIRNIGKMLPKKIEDKILDLFQSSLLSTMQRAETKTQAVDLGDCLYTALIYRDELPEDDVFNWLKIREQQVMEFGLNNVVDNRKYLRDLFYS